MPEHALVERAYENLGPWARADDSGELLSFLKVLLEPLLLMDDIARDAEAEGDGWGSLLDVDVAPEWALPWLAQFVGVRTIAALDVASQRIRIKEASGFHRGTPASIIAAAKQYLTGQRKVELYEREGSPWKFRLRTYLSETPDPDKVRAAVTALKPAGIVFDYEVQEGIEINALTGTIDSQPSTINSYDAIVPA